MEAILTASKRAIKKTAEVNGHLIGDKIVDKTAQTIQKISNTYSNRKYNWKFIKNTTNNCVEINDDLCGT